MLDPHLRLRHLRAFLHIASLGSLTAAAEVLHVSQPAVSKTIRELETILGVALFDRSGKRLRLTQAGRTFQQYAGMGLQQLIRAQDLVREAPRPRSRIAVGVLPTAATELFPAAALRFRARRPDCVVRVFTGPNWMMLSQLREGRLDMVVGRMTTDDQREGVAFHQLYSEQVLPIVRPGHPLLQTGWTAADLARYPLMLPPSGAVIYPIVRAFLHQQDMPHPDPDYENVSLAFGRGVLQASDTIWLISHGVVARELHDGTLAALPLRDTLLGGPVGVSLRDGGLMTDAQKDLMAALTDVAQERHVQT